MAWPKAKKSRTKKKKPDASNEMPDEADEMPGTYWQTWNQFVWQEPFVMDQYGMPLQRVDFMNLDIDCSDIEAQRTDVDEPQKVDVP